VTINPLETERVWMCRQLSGGGFAQVSADAAASQTINVVNGDPCQRERMARQCLDRQSPAASRSSRLTGSGANAITIGSAGALGFSQIRGGNPKHQCGRDR
jgi:hypothetical protein